MGQSLFSVGGGAADGRYLPGSSFSIGALRALVRTDDAEFRARFHQVFHDCIEPMPEGARGVGMEVVAARTDRPVVVRMDGASAAPLAIARLFPELDLVEATAPRDWRAWARRDNPGIPLAASAGDHLVLDRALPWQIVAAHVFVDHLMRVQPEWLFFHGATVAIGGAGILISGDKGAGKSTLALALAARGHGFLGDEIAAIEIRGGAIAPFRRAVSIRRGPQAARVGDFVERTRPERVTLLDGTDRIRVPISRIFPQAVARPVRLTHAFFLLPGPRPSAVPFDFSVRDIGLLSPMHATLRDGTGHGVVTCLNSFRPVRCHRLVRGGTPDEMAELIEQTVEGEWDTAFRNGPSASERFAGSRSG